jgi:phenylacetate-CoA ligase
MNWRVIPYNVRMMARHALKRSALFHRCMAAIAAFRNAAPEVQRAQQCALLDALLASAARTRHYAPLLQALRHFDHPLERLKALPYLDKDVVRIAPEAFVAPARFSVAANTSGTTGTPLQLRRDLYCIAREEAGFFCWYQAAGWTALDEMAVLRGDVVVDIARARPPFGLRDVFFNRRVLSSYHMSERTLPWSLEALRAAGMRFLAAYPSSAWLLADYVRRTQTAPMGMRAVLLASETVTPEARALIGAQLGPAHAQYGNAERVCWMTTCSAGCYHEDTQYGYTEYLPLGDGLYEIVATGFINHVMPLVRYRTGDIAVAPFGWETRCACGRPGPGCAQIIGRVDDYIVTPDGRRIGRLDHVFKDAQHVIAAQILQTTPAHLELRVMRTPQYAARDEDALRAQVCARVGNEMQITFRYVDELPRTAQGKFRAVVSVCARTSDGAA